MPRLSFFVSIMLSALLALALSTSACDSTVSGGSGGSGGSASDECDWSGPLNPDKCLTEGAQCFYADTSCQMSWTCQGGTWKSSSMCVEPATSSSSSGGGQGGAGGMGGMGGSGS